MSGWPQGTMTATAITGPGRVEAMSLPIPAERDDAILVRTSYVGLCGTDLELLHGTASYLRDELTSYPVIFGHEWSGVVTAVGAAAGWVRPGDRVTGQTMIACRHCRMCRRHEPQLCEQLTEVGLYGAHGAAADYVCIRADTATVLPPAVSLAHGTLIEPAVTVVGAFDAAGCTLSDTVAVVGTGTIGLLALQLARRLAPAVDVIGVDPAGMDLALRLGARRAYGPGEAPRDAYSLVIEASGATSALAQSIALARPGARVALVGVANGEASGITPGDITLKGVAILGIRHGLAYYDQTVDLLASGVMDAGPLIDTVVDAASAAEAFSRLEHGRQGPPKVLLRFAGDPQEPDGAAAR
ncbi:MAG: zinc-dependent alcohol dehydrogenase [Solirubrobacteraceae bacterium]